MATSSKMQWYKMNTWVDFFIVVGYISSFSFFVYHSLLSCDTYSFPYLLFHYGTTYDENRHYNIRSSLDDLIYYGLTADVYDPQTDYNNVPSMLALRDTCQYIFSNQFDIVFSNKQSRITIRYIVHYLTKRHIFKLKDSMQKDPNVNLLHEKCWQCFEKQYINDYITELTKIAMYLNDNCRLTDDIIAKTNTDDINKLRDLLQPAKVSSEGARQPHIMIVGASSAGLLSAISIAKSSFMGVPHLNQLSVFFCIFFILFLSDRVVVSNACFFNLVSTGQYPCANIEKYKTKLFNVMLCKQKTCHNCG